MGKLTAGGVTEWAKANHRETSSFDNFLPPPVGEFCRLAEIVSSRADGTLGEEPGLEGSRERWSAGDLLRVYCFFNTGG